MNSDLIGKYVNIASRCAGFIVKQFDGKLAAVGNQNEIDAAKSVRVNELNVQNQQKIEYPKNLTVAKAYIDQLERSQGLSASQITDLRQAIQNAENSKMNKKDVKKLKKFASSMEKNAGTGKSAADSARMQALVEILKNPAV